MASPKIFFRADGNSQMGVGHIIRSIALCEMLNKSFSCNFIIRNPDQQIVRELNAVCDSVVIPKAFENDIHEAQYIIENISKEDIIVLDGYHFATEYQMVFKENGNKVVTIDDIHAYHFVSDLVINHAGGIDQNHYSSEPYTEFLLGPKYALLRKEFRLAISDYSKDNRKCLICMGGADPHNDTLNVLKKCVNNHLFSHINIVVGYAFKHKTELLEYVDSIPKPLSIKVYSQLSAREMANIMKECNYAITPPSTVSYEFLSFGGILLLNVIADNQKALFSYLTKNRLALPFNEKINIEQVQQADILNRQKEIFDGKQEIRLRNAFYYLNSSLRQVRPDDLDTIYNWANDPMVRQNSFQTEKIKYADHVKWFKSKLKNKDCLFYILELDEEPIGQIRFDIENQEAKINFTIAHLHRGKGLGAKLLRKGVKRVITVHPELEIVGYVKNHNIASIKAFRSISGFQEERIESLASYRYKFKVEN